jgi:isoleucyl-tRNA synthetase
VQFVPGWDCHGLPIELKVLTELNDAAKREGKPRPQLTPLEIRTRARVSAAAAIAAQKADFVRWGVLADWDWSGAATGTAGTAGTGTVGVAAGGVPAHYATLEPGYEAVQLRVFQRLVAQGHVYRALKPVYWSPSSGTALAEAELEYAEAHRSRAAFVTFPLLDPATAPGFRKLWQYSASGIQAIAAATAAASEGRSEGRGAAAEVRPVEAVIWTTTPWTLPANVAISAHPELEYAAVEHAASGRRFLVARSRLPELARILGVPPSGSDAAATDGLRELLALRGIEMQGCLFGHPFNTHNAQAIARRMRAAGHDTAEPVDGGARVFTLEQYRSRRQHKAVGAQVSGGSGGNGGSANSAPSSSSSNSSSNSAVRDVLPSPDALEVGLGRARRRLRASVLICGEHVTDDSGTGLVHTAPGHGHDDFAVCKRWNDRHGHSAIERGSGGGRAGRNPSTPELMLPILCPVNGAGEFVAADVGEELGGLPVLTKGNEAVLSVLASAGCLLHQEDLVHRYPYDWRTKKPVLIRATKQWFVRTDDLVGPCREALAAVTMLPAASRNRLEGMLSTRTEWCISRQRAWGVPIPALYDELSGEPIMTAESIEYAASLFEQFGSDHWWTADPLDLLPPALRARVKAEGRKLVKGTDTLDVWFDSGVSWAAAWGSAAASHPPSASAAASSLSDAPDIASSAGRLSFGLGRPSDMVLEGSDQHRGWFQSSLITAVAATGAAPYRSIVTHGFVLDEQSRKMSKSLGNVIAPADVIEGRGGKGGKDKTVVAAASAQTDGGAAKNAPRKGGKGGSESGGFTTAHGVDVLRYWVASSDYSHDIVIGPGVIATVSESVRKIRNTVRFLLGNLHGYNPLAFAAVPAGVPASRSDDLCRRAWSASVSSLLEDPARLGLLDRCMLYRLQGFVNEVSLGYRHLSLLRVVQAVNAFVSQDLSSTYFDLCKDRLYADYAAADAAGASHALPDRLVSQAVMWESLRAVTAAVAPILCFTAEDVYQHSGTFIRPDPQLLAAAEGKDSASQADVQFPGSTVFDARSPYFAVDAACGAASGSGGGSLPKLPAWWSDPRLGATRDVLAALRTEANKALEAARVDKRIGSASEVRLVLRVAAGGELAPILAELQAGDQAEDLFLTSQVHTQVLTGTVADDATLAGSVQQIDAGGDAFAYGVSAEVSIGLLAPVAAEGSATAPFTERVSIEVRPALGTRCSRCWKCRPEAEAHPNHLCARCDSVVEQMGLYNTATSA